MKISLEINLSALDKSKIIEKTYKNKDGVSVTEKIYKADLVELNEKKFVAEGKDWIMKKTHFLADAQSKEEREAKAKSNFIGSGFVFERKDQQEESQEQPEESRTSPSEDYPQGIDMDNHPLNEDKTDDIGF